MQPGGEAHEQIGEVRRARVSEIRGMKESVDFPTSTTAKHVAYYAEAHELEVHFTNGHIYVYLDVPDHIFSNLKRAASAGKFLNAYVIEKFKFRKLR